MNMPTHPARRHAFLLASAVAFLLASQPSAAQEPGSAASANGTLNAKRFHLKPTVSFTFAGVDTNILTTADEPLSDSAMTMNGQIRPVWKVGPMRFSGRAGGSFVYFNKYSDQRSFDTDDALRVDIEGSRLSAFASGSYLRTRDPFDTEKQLRSPRTEYAVGGGAAIRTSDRFQIGVAARQRTVGFDDLVLLFNPFHQCPSVRLTLNRTSYIYDVNLRYAVTPITTLTVTGDTRRDRFEFSQARDANAAGVEAALEMKPTALISGKAALGYRRFSNLADRAFAVGAVVGAIDLGYVAADSMRYGVRFERDLGHSFRTDQSYYVSTHVGGSIARRLSRQWELVGEISRRWLAYTTRVNLEPGFEVFDTAAPVLSLDNLSRYDLGAVYHLRERTNVGVTFAYYKVASADRRYDRMRLQISTSHSF